MNSSCQSRGSDTDTFWPLHLLLGHGPYPAVTGTYLCIYNLAFSFWVTILVPSYTVFSLRSNRPCSMTIPTITHGDPWIQVRIMRRGLVEFVTTSAIRPQIHLRLLQRIVGLDGG